MLLETHVHTRYSKDSMLCLFCIYLMCKIRGISCIAITDHNTIKGAVEFRNKYGTKYFNKGIKVIVGEEIMTDCGEVIGLFLNEEVIAGMTIDDTIKEIIRQGGIVYIPHPYDVKRNKTVIPFEILVRNRNNIVCIECHNGRNALEEYSEKQNAIADRLSVTKVVGSDAHTMFEIGRNYMVIPDSSDLSNKEGFIEAVSKSIFIKCPCLKLSHKITKLTKLIKYITRGDINGLYRAFNKKIRG